MYRVNENEFEDFFGAHIAACVTHTCETELTQVDDFRLGLMESLHGHRSYEEMHEEEWVIHTIHRGKEEVSFKAETVVTGGIHSVNLYTLSFSGDRASNEH